VSSPEIKILNYFQLSEEFSILTPEAWERDSRFRGNDKFGAFSDSLFRVNNGAGWYA